jgi:hypothetical protein
MYSFESIVQASEDEIEEIKLLLEDLIAIQNSKVHFYFSLYNFKSFVL